MKQSYLRRKLTLEYARCISTVCIFHWESTTGGTVGAYRRITHRDWDEEGCGRLLSTSRGTNQLASGQANGRTDGPIYALLIPFDKN